MEAFSPHAVPLSDARARSAILNALRAFKPHGEAVSVRVVRDRIRAGYPQCSIPDAMLTGYICDYAIHGGYNVHFDAADGDAAEA